MSFSELSWRLRRHLARRQPGEDAEELVQWMSLLEEAQDDESELTSLPALQGVSVRMESKAGRVVANELTAIVEEGGCGALDEVGRNKLRRLREEFQKRCSRVSQEDEFVAHQ